MATPRFTIFFCAAITLVCLSLPSRADPFTVTDSQIQTCKGTCCLPKPPAGATVLPWDPEPTSTRIRRPVRLAFADPEYVAKYKLAYQRLTERPGAIAGQVAAHCAYCMSGAYGKNIHQSSLFFPWHRWYLYWHERLLQSLINDPSFTLPFWDWDSEDGKEVAPEFLDHFSPLFRARKGHHGETKESWVKHNTQPDIIAHQVISAAGAEDFFGGESARGRQFFPYFNGPDGDAAATDPLFFAHLANIDRMWWLWKRGPPDANGRPRAEPLAQSWLDSSFVFYDEKGEMRRVFVREALDITSLGYTYEDVKNDWLPSGVQLAAPFTGTDEQKLDSNVGGGRVDLVDQVRGEETQVRERKLNEDRDWYDSGAGSRKGRRRYRKYLRCLTRRRRCTRPRLSDSTTSPQDTSDIPPNVSDSPTPCRTGGGASSQPQKVYRPPPPPPPLPTDVDGARYEAPAKTGPYSVGPGAMTVHVARLLPEDRPGYRPVGDSVPGAMNIEALMITNVKCLKRTPMHFNVYINNANANYRTSTGDGYVGYWMWSPGLSGGIMTERIAIVDFLDRNNLMRARSLHVTIVPYITDADGLPMSVSAEVAKVNDTYIDYS